MNATISWLQSAAAERIGWMLVHSLWQLALLAGSYVILRHLLRRGSAAARYVSACAVMLGMAFVLPVTALLVAGPGSTIAPKIAAEPTLARAPATVLPPRGDSLLTEFPSPPAVALPLPDLAVTASPVVTTVNWMARLEAGFKSALPWVVAVWIVGVLALAARQFGGWLMLRRLCGVGAEPADEVLVGKLRIIAERLGVRRAVRLLSSVNVAVPSVIGHLKPVILLPASLITGLSPQQIEAILAHELAHVRRHDYLVNLIQVTCETVLFYHPAVWWISREIRREREHCCDDLAVQVCGDRIAYARTLATLEERRFAVPTTAMAATGGSLMQRIRRIVGQPDTSKVPRGTWLAAILAVPSICLLISLGVSAGTGEPDPFDYNNPPSAYEKGIKAADRNHRIKVDGLQFAASPLQWNQEGWLRLPKEELGPGEELFLNLGVSDGYEIVEIRLFDHDTREFIHSSAWQHPEYNRQNRLFVERIGSSNWLRMKEASGTFPDTMDVWLRLATERSGHTFVLPAKSGASASHGGSEVVVTTLLAGAMNGKSGPTGEMEWDLATVHDEDRALTVNIENRGKPLDGRYHLVAVNKDGSRHPMDDTHFRDFRRMGTRAYFRMDVALTDVEHFELVPFKNRQKFFFNGLEVPPRRLLDTGYTLDEILNALSERSSKYQAVPMRIEYIRTVNDVIGQAARTEENMLLSQWNNFREEARQEATRDEKGPTISRYLVRGVRAVTGPADGAAGDRIQYLAHDTALNIERTLWPHIHGPDAWFVNTLREVGQAGNLKIEMGRLVDGRNVTGNDPLTVTLVAGGQRLTLVPEWDWAIAEYLDMKASDFRRYGEFWFPTRLANHTTMQDFQGGWMNFRDEILVRSVNTSAEIPKEAFQIPQPKPGDRVTVAYPRWEPQWENAAVEPEKIRDAVRSEHTFTGTDALSAKDARIWEVSLHWRDAGRVRRALELLPGEEFAYGDVTAALPFLSPDGARIVWATYDPSKKLMIPVDVLPEEASVEEAGFKFEAGFIPEKSEVMVGESIYVTFYIRNTGTGSIYLETGGDGPGVRSYRFQLSATDELGNPARDPNPNPGHFGGLQGLPPEIKPGETYSEKLQVSKWIAFDRPGRYTVRGARTLQFPRTQEFSRDYALVHPLATSFHLTVLPQTDQGLSSRIEELGRQLRAEENESNARLTSQLLTHTGDTRAIPYLLWAANKWSGDSWALHDLAAFKDDPRVVALYREALTASRGNARRSTAARLMGEGGNQAFLPDLLQAFDREDDKFVLTSVATALGQLGDAQALPILKKHRDHTDPHLRLQVEQALVKCGEALGQSEAAAPVWGEVATDAPNASGNWGPMMGLKSQNAMHGVIAALLPLSSQFPAMDQFREVDHHVAFLNGQMEVSINYERNFVAGDKTKSAGALAAGQPWCRIAVRIGPDTGAATPLRLTSIHAGQVIQWDGHESIRGYRVVDPPTMITIAVQAGSAELREAVNRIIDRELTAMIAGSDSTPTSDAGGLGRAGVRRSLFLTSLPPFSDPLPRESTLSDQ